MQQVYLKTSATAKAENEIIKHIKANPLPLEKKIPLRLFNALLSGIRNIESLKYAESGIPFKHEQLEYTLRVKHGD